MIFENELFELFFTFILLVSSILILFVRILNKKNNRNSQNNVNSQPFQYIFEYILNNSSGGNNGGGVNGLPTIQEIDERIRLLEDLESRIELVIRAASVSNILLDEQGYVLNPVDNTFDNSPIEIDTVILQTGNLILLKDQTDPTENGVFVVFIENENQPDQKTRFIRIGDEYFEENLQNNGQPRKIRQTIPGLPLENIFLGYLSYGTIVIINQGMVNAGLKFIQNSPSVNQTQNIVSGNIKLNENVSYAISNSSIECDLISDNMVPPLYRVYNLFYSDVDSADVIGSFKINSETQWNENKFKLFVNKSTTNDAVLDFTESCLCVYFPEPSPTQLPNIGSNCNSSSCQFLNKLYIKPGGRVLLYRSGSSISLYIKAFHKIYALI